MKVIFIEPRSSDANVYSKLHMPLLGPIYLGTILKNRGHQVEIYKEDIHTPDYSRLQADVIGISILTSTAKRGYEIASRFPKEKVIIGGIHASLLPQEAVRYARQVIIGEAEHSIVDVVEGRVVDKLVKGVPVENLDNLPEPDFSLVKGFKYSTQFIPISTSRGCPHDCSFCSVTKTFGRKYRFRSTKSILKEMESRTSKNLFFCDDNFAAHTKRTHELLTEMLTKKLKKWTCQVRCDVTKDAALMNLMYKAGCRAVCVGFESVNALSLKAYKKMQNVEEIISAIKSFHNKKIKIHGMFVLGGDDDDKKTVWETVHFARKHKIDTLQMSALTPFPGTRVYDQLEKEGRIFSKDWSLYDGQHVVFSPKLLSAKDLQTTLVDAYTKFYALSRSISLFLRMRYRNSFFTFVGFLIVRQWKKVNCHMSWLPVSADKKTPYHVQPH